MQWTSERGLTCTSPPHPLFLRSRLIERRGQLLAPTTPPIPRCMPRHLVLCCYTVSCHQSQHLIVLSEDLRKLVVWSRPEQQLLFVDVDGRSHGRYCNSRNTDDRWDQRCYQHPRPFMIFPSGDNTVHECTHYLIPAMHAIMQEHCCLSSQQARKLQPSPADCMRP